MTREQTIEQIARSIGIETLEKRHRDELDFHDVPVWQIRKALLAAYDAGRAKPTRLQCPACQREIELRTL